MHRVLVVEDEPSIADTIVYALRTEGMEPLWHNTLREARERLAEDEVDLIVLDVGLPDGDGFEWCKELRKSSEIPVIFLTARADEIDRVVGLEIGADDYMVKPFSPRELTARIKAVLRRHTRRVKSDLSCHAGCDEDAPPLPFRLDERRARIHYYEAPLELSRYEYRILETLIRRPGWVFSREQLMDAAWDEPDASMERTVDTHIKTIRQKLRAVREDAAPIRTHRGLGYSLRERW